MQLSAEALDMTLLSRSDHRVSGLVLPFHSRSSLLRAAWSMKFEQKQSDSPAQTYVAENMPFAAMTGPLTPLATHDGLALRSTSIMRHRTLLTASVLPLHIAAISLTAISAVPSAGLLNGVKSATVTYLSAAEWSQAHGNLTCNGLHCSLQRAGKKQG